MPAHPRWLLAIPDAITQLEALDRDLLTRRDLEQLFGVSKPRAAILMRTFGADRTGNARTLERASLLKQLRVRRKGVAFSGEVDRRARVMTTLRQARITGIRVPVAPDVRSTRLAGLPPGVSIAPGRIAVEFTGAREAVARLFALAQALLNDYDRFEDLVGGGRGAGMSEELVRINPAPATMFLIGDRPMTLPQLIVDAGPAAAERFLEFFAAQIANDRTRAAYAQAAGQFLTWCQARGLSLRALSPLHVAGYIRTHRGSVPTVKQHLAAIRVLCDWLVVSQVLPANPAAAVRGPKHVVTKGSTPVLSAAEARTLIDGIDVSSIVGLRDRALIGVMVYSFARVSAVTGMRRGDYFTQGRRGWLRLHEKGGKRHDVPAHHLAEAYLDAYLDAARVDDPTAPLFQSVNRARDLTGRAIQRREVLAMIKRRAAAADLPVGTCCHTFRATGITAYLSNGGTLEHAQQIAAHASPKTTKLYDRTADTISLDEIERIVI